jgi:hypothetical protein
MVLAINAPFGRGKKYFSTDSGIGNSMQAYNNYIAVGGQVVVGGTYYMTLSLLTTDFVTFDIKWHYGSSTGN